jgi:hypothetical protein
MRANRDIHRASSLVSEFAAPPSHRRLLQERVNGIQEATSAEAAPECTGN